MSVLFYIHKYVHMLFCIASRTKHLDGSVLSAPNCGSQGCWFDCCWRKDSAHYCTRLHCTKPFIITLPSSWYDLNNEISWPRWLSWMRCPTGDQEVAGSTTAEVGNILSWRLIMKYFLRSFSPFRWFKKGSCQFLAKECAQYWLTA